MSYIDRRQFLAVAANVPVSADPAQAIHEVLRNGVNRHRLPAVVAMAATPKAILYSGAFGTRDPSGVPLRPDSIFGIASMTKAITTVAALQLVEQGKVTLDEPVHQHLPALKDLDVLHGYDAAGKPILRPAQTPVTLRHLITHTSGFCYDTWDEGMFRYSSLNLPRGTKPGPLMFEPGKRWQYGQGVDWAGRLVEALSGLSLEAHFQKYIFEPLGMVDTSFIFPEAKFDRLVTGYRRVESGELQPTERKLPSRPTEFNGGGGLYSTAADYVRFMQMILNRGQGPTGQRTGGRRILKAATVRSMGINQIGTLTAGKMKSFRPLTSLEVDIQPGQTEKWGLGFLINTTPYPGGRAAGSLAWAGLLNTYYWIDPARRRCGVILMQLLPFVDKEAVALFDEFERAVYA